MYIEFVIADNFLLTFLAGRAAARTSRCGSGRARAAVAAAIGTAVAIAYPFFSDTAWLRLAVKPLLWITLTVIMFYRTPRALLSGLLFFGYTLCFGGASLAAGLAIYGDYSAAVAFSAKYPLFLTLGAGCAVYFAAERCSGLLRIKRAREPYEYRIEVELFGERLSFSAFLDTGNCVFDAVSGLPVIITDARSLTKKLGAIGAVELSRALPKLRTLTAATSAGDAKMYMLKPSCVTVYSDKTAHKINAMIGILTGGGNRFSASHEMLIGPFVTEGI